MTQSSAIIFIGPPGSGKGTQANEVVKRFDGFWHFNTGRVLEEVLYADKNKEDPVIQIERLKFEAGELCSSEWVKSVVKDGIERIAATGKGIIFSGSPRTREEAEFMMPILLQMYGQGHVYVVHLAVSDETSIFRNTHRRVCKSCGTPFPWSEETKALAYCTICGGELKVRTLDNEKAMEERLYVYKHSAESILAFFVALGLPIFEVSGERSPEVIATDIDSTLKKVLE
ncbi:MAG: nucleoside monophosphate kinase [Patescibacteria group bacterium]